MKTYLEYKAGPAILDMIRDEGLKPEKVRVFSGPAGGPKWFVSVGFDRALMKSRLLGRGGGRVLLVGASAGAWRCLAMACQDPPSVYENLRIAYSRNIFTAQDTPLSVAAALQKNVNDFVKADDIPFILDHPIYDLAIHTVTSKGPAASGNRAMQGSALLATALMNTVSPAGMKVFFERVVFFCAREDPSFLKSFNGSAVRLNKENLRMAALATGSLPYVGRGSEKYPRGTAGCVQGWGAGGLPAQSGL